MTPRRKHRATVLALTVGVALVAAGCSTTRTAEGVDSVPTSSSGATSTSTAVDTTVVSASSTTVAPSTSVVAAATTAPPVVSVAPTTAAPAPGPTCPSNVLPAGGAVNLVDLVGDWNGDGANDVAKSWGVETPSGINWFVRLEVSSGGGSTVELGNLGVGFAALVDRVDVDFSLGLDPGANHDEVLAVVSPNVAGQNLGVFGVNDAGCAFQFDNGVGGDYEIPVRGTAGALSGLKCDGGAGSQFLVRLEATNIDPATWATRDIKIERPSAQTLVDGIVIDSSLASDDIALADYSVAMCDGTMWIGDSADY